MWEKRHVYNVYWNVAVGEPLPEKTKTVNVIVEWSIKGNNTLDEHEYDHIGS